MPIFFPFLVALPWVALVAAPLAQPGPDSAALLRRGTELYKAGVYDKAALAFEEAWKAAPTATTALNLAQSLEGAGRPAEALEWYARVIAGEAPGGPRRAAAESGRAHLGGHGFLAVTCGPPDAALVIGAATGRCPTFGGYLAAGRHVVTLTAADRAPFTGEVEVVAGQRRELTLDLAREVTIPVRIAPDADGVRGTERTDAAALGPATVVAASPDDPAVPAWVGYTLLGLGGAALVLGGLYYGQAADTAERAPTGASRDDVARRASLATDFETDRNVAYGGLGAGAALLLGGGAVLLFGGSFR